MKTPRPIVTIVVIVLLALGAAIFIALAIVAPLGNVDSGLRAWNGKFILGLVAFGFLGFAALILARVAGRRSDSRFTDSLGAELAIPVYIYPSTREQLGSALPGQVLGNIPSRAALAVDSKSVALWSRPNVKHADFLWPAISTVAATEVGQRRFDGLSVRLTDGHSVEVVLVGPGLSGRPNREIALDVAARVRALRP